MISENQREILIDIFTNSDANYKIDMELNTYNKSFTVTYNDLCEEWFKELLITV